MYLASALILNSGALNNLKIEPQFNPDSPRSQWSWLGQTERARPTPSRS